MAKGTKIKFTTQGLRGIKLGQWVNDTGHVGAGQLQARGMAGGEAALYYRYTAPRSVDGKQVQVRIPIGTFPTTSLTDARERARELSRRYESGDKDLRGALEADDREEARQTEAARLAEEAKGGSTLGALLTAYVDQLEQDKRPSSRLVRGTIHRHVEKVWPKLWAMPAADVTIDDLLPVVARVVDLGRLREAAKLRSYLRAAYSAAIAARQSAQGSAALRSLALSHNPVRDLVAIKGASKPRKKALTADELRCYWTRISAMDSPAGAALRFHLLTGGQRVVQLARLTVADFDADAMGVHMLDPKGRRSEARKHFVPLIPAALAALNAMRGDLGPCLFTLTHGLTPATYESLRDHLMEVRDAMLAAGELPTTGTFTVGTIRATVETRLSAAGVSRDDRAQLQSHGLGGIQDRSYNHHNYLVEKRQALEVLHRLLTGTDATVTSIKRKRGA